MLKNIVKSLLYGLLITAVYVIAANLVYRYIFGRTMYADIYYYEWVQYLVVAIIMLICTTLIEVVRHLINSKS